MTSSSSSVISSGSVGNTGAGVVVRGSGPEVDGDTGVARHAGDEVGEVAWKSTSRFGLSRHQRGREARASGQGEVAVARKKSRRTCHRGRRCWVERSCCMTGLSGSDQAEERCETHVETL